MNIFPVLNSFRMPVVFKNTGISNSINNISFKGTTTPVQDVFELQDEDSIEIARVQNIIRQNERRIEELDTEIRDFKRSWDRYDYLEKMRKKRSRLISLNNCYAEYLEQYRTNKPYSFVYNPEFSALKKREIGKERGIILSSDLAKELGMENNVIIRTLCHAGVFDDYHFCTRTTINDKTLKDCYINTRTEKNKEFLDYLKDNWMFFCTATDFGLRFNVPEIQMGRYLKEKRDIFFGYDNGDYPELLGGGYNGLINIREGKGKEFVEEIKKLYPQKSKYYNYSEIPANYLSKLGFGDIETIREMVKKGALDGRNAVIKTKDGICHITLVQKNLKNEHKLCALRYNSGKIKETKEVAKELGISLSRIKEALISGEMEIIPEYLFTDDWNKYLVDITNPKNEEFIQKVLFEKQIEEEIKAQQRQERKQAQKDAQIQRLSAYAKPRSLRLKLVWSYCVKTRQIASDMANKDGYLCQLLAKEDEGEELTNRENAKVNSYRKSFWTKAGTNEFKEGYRKANQALDEYFAFGIDGVSDENAREIIRQYYES